MSQTLLPEDGLWQAEGHGALHGLMQLLAFQNDLHYTTLHPHFCENHPLHSVPKVLVHIYNQEVSGSIATATAPSSNRNYYLHK